MKKRMIVSVTQVLILAFASAMLFMACEGEDSPDTGDLDGWFARNPHVSDSRSQTMVSDVKIQPESVTVTFVGQEINFRAHGGRGDYRWDVSSPAAGTIRRLGNTREAVYRVTRIQGNSVIAYDSRGQAGIATVSGQTTALVATANPDTITQVGGRSILTATGGTPPYTWEVADIALGSIDGPNVGNSVVYKASTVGSGDNSVTCTDSAGNTVSVVIMQP